MTDIEQDRLPTVVFNRYLVFEGNFVATAIAILPSGQQSAGYSTAALADWRAECPLIYRSRGLNRCCQRGRSIPLSTRMICRGTALSRRYAADRPRGQL